MGNKVGEAVGAGKFAECSKLTHEGFALAADLGLLVARLLLKDHNVTARWVLVTQKRNLHFNHPVIQGSSKVQLNPITGAITEFSYALKNGWDSEIWAKMYSHWKEVFSSNAP